MLGYQHKLWLTFYNFVGEDRGDGGLGVCGGGGGGGGVVCVGGGGGGGGGYLWWKMGGGQGTKISIEGYQKKNRGKKWNEGKQEKNG